MKEFFKVILYQPLFNLLVFFAYLVPGHSVGWAIIMLTLLVRLVLWVPNAKAIKAPLLLRQYQPELNELQEKIKDPQERARAQMAFYKEKGINPLSGCLPLLIQLPVLLILYQVFITGLRDIRPDLLYSFTPHMDSINSHFLGIDLAKPDKIFLPLLAAVLQFFQVKFSQQTAPAPVNKNDPAAMMGKQMLYIFPAMTYFIGSTLPAGLSLYWATTTAVQAYQQYIITKNFKLPDKRVEVKVRKK